MESARQEKGFTSMEEVVRYLETLPVGTYVKGYDCDGYDQDNEEVLLPRGAGMHPVNRTAK